MPSLNTGCRRQIDPVEKVLPILVTMLVKVSQNMRGFVAANRTKYRYRYEALPVGKSLHTLI